MRSSTHPDAGDAPQHAAVGHIRSGGRAGDAGRVFDRMWVAPVLAFVAAQVVVMASPRRLLLPRQSWRCGSCRRCSPTSPGCRSSRHHPPLNREQRARSAPHGWKDLAVLRRAADAGRQLAHPRQLSRNRGDVIAHRTSPTNIGLQLLASLGAYDFGYLGITGVIDRLEPTFDTLLRMQRYRGHFYNW